MQRFAGLWTGDNASMWEFMQINISQVLALGLTGQALSGQDIGGFEPNGDEQWADPELLIRWTSMGAFLPWFRNHYIKKGRKLFREPYEYQHHKDTVPQEVQYLYDCTLPVCKYYIELRYTLLQLFYDAMFENTLNGMPICRALFLTNPDDAALFNDKQEFLNTEFMVRDSLLVAPVLEKEAYDADYNCKKGRRDVYLPSGNRWYQFTNHQSPLGEAIEGGTTICGFDATINGDTGHIPYIVPLYVKEGAIIPVIELEQYVGEKNANGEPNPVTLYVYPGQEGSYTMYLDDGVSRSSQPEGNVKYGADPMAKGEYREVEITHSRQSASQRKISVKTVHDGYTPKYEDYMIVAALLENGEHVDSISLNGDNVHQIVSGGTLYQIKKTPGVCWLYDSSCNAVYVKVPNDNPDMEIVLTYGN
jgi:alpha-glucosidase